MGSEEKNLNDGVDKLNMTMLYIIIIIYCRLTQQVFTRQRYISHNRKQKQLKERGRRTEISSDIILFSNILTMNDLIWVILFSFALSLGVFLEDNYECIVW